MMLMGVTVDHPSFTRERESFFFSGKNRRMKNKMALLTTTLFSLHRLSLPSLSKKDATSTPSLSWWCWYERQSPWCRNELLRSLSLSRWSIYFSFFTTRLFCAVLPFSANYFCSGALLIYLTEVAIEGGAAVKLNTIVSMVCFLPFQFPSKWKQSETVAACCSCALLLCAACFGRRAGVESERVEDWANMGSTTPPT